jgi:hypothetical protein
MLHFICFVLAMAALGISTFRYLECGLSGSKTLAIAIPAFAVFWVSMDPFAKAFWA